MDRLLPKFVAFSLILLLQGPALLLQEIAWASMLIRYSSQDGIPRGIRKTFDGKHPCCLCRKAEAIRQEEKKHQDQPAEAALKSRMQWSDMVSCRTAELIPPDEFPAPQAHFPDPFLAHAAQHVGPPTPPPECILSLS